MGRSDQTYVLQRDNQTENLIPILMLNQRPGCNEAMQLSFQLAEEEARGFHEIEEYLQRSQTDISRLVSDISIKGCKNVSMGLIY
jgi:proline dehydrogenase